MYVLPETVQRVNKKIDEALIYFIDIKHTNDYF